MTFKEKKNVLITGAAGQIGKALSMALQEENHDVIGIDILDQRMINQESSKFKYYKCDLTKLEECKKLIKSIENKFGCIDVIINCAGLIHNEPIIKYVEGEMIDHSEEGWDRTIDSNLKIAFNISCACIPNMIKRFDGTIIHISSICANGNPGQAAYSAAKGAINSLTRSQAKELGQFGIRVACIAPGFINTESTINALGDGAIKRIKKEIPLRRLGKVEDVYHAVQFIMHNNYFTGKVLELDGGLTI